MSSGKEETSNQEWKEKGLARASAKLLSEGQKAANARKRVKSYKDLLVWQKGISLVKKIYRLTQRFPDTERFGLVSQMRRAAVSIPSNIAEGQARHTRKEFIQFFLILKVRLRNWKLRSFWVLSWDTAPLQTPMRLQA